MRVQHFVDEATATRTYVVVVELPALQVNVRGGALPPAEDTRISYLTIPLNVP